MDRIEAKKLVIKAGIELVKTGLIARTWGNVSCRIDENIFAITPSGREYLTLTADDIVEVNIEDLSYHGNIKPSSEKGIHAAVYQLHPNINFIIHTHQENASAISAAGLDFIKLSKHQPSLVDEIIFAKYALPGTKSLCKNVADALKISKENALILKNHGVLCFGEDYEQTFDTAHQLEIACGDYINEKGGKIQTEQSNGNQAIPKGLNYGKKAFKNAKKNACIVFNGDPDVVRFSCLGIDLKPLLDDFAQIVGRKSKTVENNQNLISKAFKTSSTVFIKDVGALCWGKNENDATAVSMITRKSCKAYFGASLFGKPRPINPVECALMRFVYLKKYSTMSEK